LSWAEGIWGRAVKKGRRILSRGKILPADASIMWGMEQGDPSTRRKGNEELHGGKGAALMQRRDVRISTKRGASAQLVGQGRGERRVNVARGKPRSSSVSVFAVSPKGRESSAKARLDDRPPQGMGGRTGKKKKSIRSGEFHFHDERKTPFLVERGERHFLKGDFFRQRDRRDGPGSLLGKRDISLGRRGGKTGEGKEKEWDSPRAEEKKRDI